MRRRLALSADGPRTRRAQTLSQFVSIAAALVVPAGGDGPPRGFAAPGSTRIPKRISAAAAIARAMKAKKSGTRSDSRHFTRQHRLGYVCHRHRPDCPLADGGASRIDVTSRL